MAGGGANSTTQNPASSQQLSQWLQNFPTAQTGGATAAGAPNPQAQTPQNPFLARLAAMGAQGQNGQPSQGMGLMNQGLAMARGGQQPMPQAPMPRQTPVMSGGPPVAPGAGAGAGSPLTGGGGAFSGGNINPQLMSQLMMRGLLGGGGR